MAEANSSRGTSDSDARAEAALRPLMTAKIEMELTLVLVEMATKEIIGHEMESGMTKELTRTALDRAVRYRKSVPGSIRHSGRGIQYCATSYQRAVVALGMRPSMSRKGNCHDGAPVESLWGTLREESSVDQAAVSTVDSTGQSNGIR